jgi:uncharacterized protein (TIGR02996 family)
LRELDYTALAELVAADTLDEPSAALGVDLDYSAAAWMIKVAKREQMPRVLGLIARAVQSDLGLGYDRVGAGPRYTHYLAIRWADADGRLRVTVAIRWNKLRSLGWTWPVLKQWVRSPAEHAAAAAAWGQSVPGLTVPVRRRTAPKYVARPDEAALRRAVIADPDDLAARLVFADWLLERGDVRGELIRLECRDAHTPEEIARIAHILAASAASLAGEAAPYTPIFHRGFVDKVSMTVAAFARHGEKIFTSEPVRTLYIANPRLSPSDVAKLAGTAALRLVRELAIGHHLSRDTPMPLAALGTSPHLARLRRLGLSYYGTSHDDWRELLERMDAPALEELQLFRNRTSPAIYAALARNPSLTRLRSLHDDRHEKLEPAGVTEALAELAERRPSLERLSLVDYQLDGEVTGPLLPQLRELTLEGVTFADRLARRARTPRLERLRLRNCGIFLDGIQALLAGPLAALAVTGYDDCWTREGVDALARILLALPAAHPLRQIALPDRSQPTPALLAQLQARFEVG